mmetsp:Transcript_26110/g.77449  ORF Transcript_26110/g.77449 Transcript_26110/m.77449 type:complete len:211 (-) Transcript_26110:2072-2704(-)
MDVDWLVLHHRLIALLRVLARRVEKEARGDGLAYPHVCAPSCHQLQFVSVHDGQQLLAHVLRALERPVLHKVLLTPRDAELVCLPLLVHRQQRQVVALWLEELCLLLIRLRLLLLRSEENVLRREHGQDGQDLLAAAEVDRCDEDLAHRRFQWELGHLPAQLGQQTLLVERPEVVKLLERCDERGGGRGVHEVEPQKVVDAHGLEREHRH